MLRAATHGLTGYVILAGLQALALGVRGLAAAPAAVPLAGRVVSAEGEPVAGAQVWIYTAGLLGEEARAVSAISDSEGRFAIPERALADAPPEARVIIAWAEGQALTWQFQAEAPDPSQLRLILGPAAAFAGWVHDASRQPLGNVTVRVACLVLPDPRRFLALDPALNLLTTKTQPDGTFSLPGIPPQAQVWLELQGPDSAWKMLSVSASEAADLDLTLVPTGRLAGRVTLAETGQPAAGLLVCCESGAGKNQAQALTDAAGRYQISHLEEGEYKVWVQPSPSLLEWIPTGP